MKNAVLYLLATLAAVNAMPAMSEASLEQRQLGDTSNELKDGSCMPVTFIMARGSTETGNMGTIAGPPTCMALKSAMPGQVACQGVGAEDGYAAALAPNFQPKNTDSQSIAGATKIINLANTKCPDTEIVLGGYSQGSAVMDNAVQGLPAATQSKIKGVVLFGFTRNAQDNGQIPGYPQDQTKVFCATGDLVCDNTLTITAAHLTYAVDGPAAGQFLAQQAGGSTGGATKKKGKKAARTVSEEAVAHMAGEFSAAKSARGIEVE